MKMKKMPAEEKKCHMSWLSKIPSLQGRFRDLNSIQADGTCYTINLSQFVKRAPLPKVGKFYFSIYKFSKRISMAL